MIPSPGSLLQTVDRLPEAANLALLARLHKSLRLLHVDFFVKHSIKESGLDVQSLNVPVLERYVSKKEPDRLEASNGRECFLVVNALYLRETLGNQSSLVATVSFVGINPLRLNGLAIRR